MQTNSLPMAMQQVRARLGLRQADLARKLGCKQNTVSKWEAGKAHPGTESLIRLWQMADASERKLIQSYLSEQFHFLSETEQNAFVKEILGKPRRHFMIDMAEVLGRPEAPEFLREIASLYWKVRKRADALEIFKQASTWLHIQFQMREYVDLKASRTPPGHGTTAPVDPVEMELREAASEPLQPVPKIAKRRAARSYPTRPKRDG